MKFSVFFTNQCNLKCRYCYEGKKSNPLMNISLIDQTIKFISEIMEKQKENENLFIQAHGGEPLIAFEQIEYFFKSLKKIYPQAKFALTTNGTLLSHDIIQFLSTNFDFLSVSIDGNEKAHNANRVFEDGTGSYNLVIHNALKLLKLRPDLTARMTVNEHNYFYLYDSIVELINLGFRHINPVPDKYSKNWTDAMFEQLYVEFRKVADYVNHHPDRDELAVGFINGIRDKSKNSSCDGGKTSFIINADGNIYPCIISNNLERYCLGSVGDGLDTAKVSKIHEVDAIPVRSCEGCTRYDYCLNTKCKLINEISEGNYFSPIAVKCELENIMVRLYNNTGSYNANDSIA